MRRRESSDHQQRLANDVTGLDRAVRVGSLLQRESLSDDRPDPSRGRLPHRPLSKQPGIHRRKLYVLDPPHGYVAPPGLLEVDRREPAAWRAVGREPAAACGDLESGPADRPAHAVEAHARPGPAGAGEDLPEPA